MSAPGAFRVRPRRHGPFSGVVDPEGIAAYAVATADSTPAVLTGRAVPVVFPIVHTAHRYAAVSGDWAAHHFDIAVARAAGFDFVFAHGRALHHGHAHAIAFDAVAGGAEVITHGRLELRT